MKSGKDYEPIENKPLIGWRGASRYIDKDFKPAFRLELKAFKKAINEIGLNNIKIIIPFCRKIREAEEVLKIIKTMMINGQFKYQVERQRS